MTNMRWALFLGSLALALVIGVWALQVPAPRDAGTSATEFSARRAMADVRQIGARPHPVGSADHRRVQGYLVRRMASLGLNPVLQSGALSPEAITRLTRWGGDPAAAGNAAVNIVGVLPGRDPAAAAVVLMAHYDSAWGSPGAADDGAGVAAVLEAVRAIKARGPADRTLVVLFTDADDPEADREWLGGVSSARAAGIPVHVVGVGDPGQSHTLLISGEKEEAISTKLFEDVAESIAAEGQGTYVPMRREPFDAEAFFRQAIDGRSKRLIDDESRVQRKDRSAWFYATGGLFLVLAWWRGRSTGAE